MIGLIFKELYSQSPDHFSDHASVIVPVAFVARFDQKKSSSSIWSSVLEEGMGTEAGAVRLYTKEIVQEIQSNLTSTSWALKISASQVIIHEFGFFECFLIHSLNLDFMLRQSSDYMKWMLIG